MLDTRADMRNGEWLLLYPKGTSKSHLFVDHPFVLNFSPIKHLKVADV